MPSRLPFIDTSHIDIATRVVYHDDALVIVDKPAGMLSVPGRGEAKQDSAATRVQALFSDALIVHRLDMPTSGLMVLARGKANHRALSIAFAQRQVQKNYIARVAGIPSSSEGEIDQPLIADWPNRPRQKICDEQGKPSLTRWRLLSTQAEGNTAYLALEPITGRSHQLRVHLAFIGHPILGDALYAPHVHSSPYPRLMLQATQLAFQHPLTQESLEFKLAADF